MDYRIVHLDKCTNEGVNGHTIGGTVDATLLYTLAILDWFVLAAVGTGIILDAVKRRPNLQHNRL